MKLRDIWGKAMNALNPAVVQEKVEQVHTETQERREAAQDHVRDLSRYQWVTVGFNRHERRGMAKELKRLLRAAPKKANPLQVAKRIGWLRFQLNNAPVNHPQERVWKDGRDQLQTNNPLYWRGVRTA